MRRQKIAVIKVGGAALTDKAVRGSIDAVRVDLAADAIAAAWAHARKKELCEHVPEVAATKQSVVKDDDEHGFGLVVVHGAGSCGHFEARTHGIARGIVGALDSEEAETQLVGFAETRLAVARLSAAFVSALVARGLPAVVISPFPRWRTRSAGKEIASNSAHDALASLNSVIGAGLLPVVHGDAVLDDEQGVSILSGDVILPFLARSWDLAYCAFLTDVSGVYDRDPKTMGTSAARRIPRLFGPELRTEQGTLVDRELASVAIAYSNEASLDIADVTGGMRGKLESAAAVVSQGVVVYIVNVADSASAIAAACGHTPEVGTTIIPLSSNN